MSEYLGIHITINGASVSGGVGVPEVFIASQGQRVFNLLKPAKTVMVYLNRKPQILKTVGIPNGDCIHVENTAKITYEFDLDLNDIVQVIPYY